MTALPKNDRLDLRLPTKQKRMIERAAECLGLPVSAFVLGVATRKARRVLQDSEVTSLTNRDRDRFLELLGAADEAPNAALVRAAERYKTQVG